MEERAPDNLSLVLYSPSPPSSPASFHAFPEDSTASDEESSAKQAVLTHVEALLKLADPRKTVTLEYCLPALEAAHQRISQVLDSLSALADPSVG